MFYIPSLPFLVLFASVKGQIQCYPPPDTNLVHKKYFLPDTFTLLEDHNFYIICYNYFIKVSYIGPKGENLGLF